jgi:hypothetical protein
MRLPSSFSRLPGKRWFGALLRQPRQSYAQRGKELLKVAVWLVGLVALFAVVGFFAVPPIAKHYLVKSLSELLNRQVAIQDIKINPFALTASVRGFSVKEARGQEVFVSFDELFVDLQAESIIQRGPILREIRLERPYAHIVRREDGSYNFSDLVAKFASASEKPAVPDQAKPKEQPRFSLNNIQLIAGQVVFDDEPKKAKHVVTDLNIAIPFLSNLPYTLNQYVVPSFSAKVNDTPIALNGRSKPFAAPPEAQLDIDIYALDIPRYLEYLPVKLPFKIPSALLETRLTATFTLYPDKPPLLVLSGKVALDKFAMTQLDGRALLNFAQLEVPVESATVFARDVKLGNVLLRNPEVFVRRERDGSLNWMTVVPKAGHNGSDSPPNETATDREGSEPQMKLRLEEARIEQGKVHFADEAAPKLFKTDIEGLLVALRKFALPQVDPATLEVALGTAFGESIKTASTLFISPLNVDGNLEVTGVKPRNYSAYYGHLVRFDIEDGTLNLSTRFRAAQTGQDISAAVVGLDASLSKLRLRKRGAKDDFLSVPALDVKGVDVDSAKHTAQVGEVSSKLVQVRAVREKNGTIDLTQLTAEGAGTQGVASAPNTAAQKPAQAWQWLVKKIALDRYAIRFEDQVPMQPVTHVAEPIKINIENLSNRLGSNAKVEVAIGINKTGKVLVSGPIGISPLHANLSLDVQSVDLVPLQPYLEDKLNILVSSGEALLHGRWELTPPEPGPMATHFTGDVGINNFASVDKATSEDFLKWRSLHVSGIDATYHALAAGKWLFESSDADAATRAQLFSLQIQEVALSDFYSRLIIYPTGKLNVQNVLASGADAQPADEPATAEAKAQVGAANQSSPPAKQDKPTKPEPAAQVESSQAVPQPPIAIAKVTLQGGNINFSDFFIKPNYSANLTELGGSVTGLSSQLDTTADVDLRGRFAKSAPVEIKGRINPLLQNPYLDIKANVRDIELGPFTPYSAKYVGYAIEKGKMSFDVAYKIENRKLAAANRLTLDQLTFGERIDSPTATKLPVLFAVALLKDRNGVIDVNLPISGSVDDPKFSVSGIILHIIFNLIEKAITSPFALISSLVGGGGEELSYVSFDPGRAVLVSGQEDKLTKLQKALSDRPALKLDATGHSDLEKDRQGLRQYRFDQQLKAQKLKDLVKKGSSVSSVNEVKIEPQEYEIYLKRAYKDAKFPKPRNVIGFQKDLPNEEVEKLMLANTVVTDDDLIQLANRRAQATKDFITRGDQVAVERVFLLAPKLDAAKGDEKLPGARVDFSLK